MQEINHSVTPVGVGARFNKMRDCPGNTKEMAGHWCALKRYAMKF